LEGGNKIWAHIFLWNLDVKRQLGRIRNRLQGTFDMDRYVFSAQRPDCLWSLPSDYSYPSSAVVENAWNFTSTPPCLYTVRWLANEA
jgi:hypothetical protein